MPVVLRVGPYRFLIYPGDEGEPAHVHVQRDRPRAKIWLRTPGTLDAVSVAEPGGFRAAELRRVVRTVEAHRALLLSKWDRMFPDAGPDPARPQ